MSIFPHVQIAVLTLKLAKLNKGVVHRVRHVREADRQTSPREKSRVWRCRRVDSHDLLHHLDSCYMCVFRVFCIFISEATATAVEVASLQRELRDTKSERERKRKRERL